MVNITAPAIVPLVVIVTVLANTVPVVYKLLTPAILLPPLPALAPAITIVLNVLVPATFKLPPTPTPPATVTAPVVVEFDCTVDGIIT